MHSRLVAAAGILGLAAFAPGAHAAVIAQVINVASSVGTERGPDFTTFSRFDSNLGVLTGASLQFTGTVTPGMVVNGTPVITPGPVTFVPRVGLGTFLQGSAPDASVFQDLPSETANFVASGNPVAGQGPFPATQLYQAFGSPEAASITVPIPSSILPLFSEYSSSLFSGPTSFLEVTNEPLATGGLDSDITVTTGQVQLAFTYTPAGVPVPEPARLSLGLLGAGAAWLAFARRQRSPSA